MTFPTHRDDHFPVMHQRRDGISKRRGLDAKLFGQVNAPQQMPADGVGTAHQAETVGEVNPPVRQRGSPERPRPLAVRLPGPVVASPPFLLAGLQVQTNQALPAQRLDLGIDPGSARYQAGVSLAEALAPQYPRTLRRPGQMNPFRSRMAVVSRAAAM